jgi:Ca-activated chloride channel family protein
MTRTSRLVAFAATALAGVTPAPQPASTSEPRTEFARATVLDERNRMVASLARDDFEVLDNGELRPITQFAHRRQPLTGVLLFDVSGSLRDGWLLAAAGRPPPGARLRMAGVNQQTLRLESALDRLLDRAFAGLADRLQPADRIRVGGFGARTVIRPVLTRCREDLLDPLRAFGAPAGPSPLWDAIDDAMTALADEAGHRTVIVFTDGRANANRLGFEQVRERALAEGVAVYVIAPTKRRRLSDPETDQEAAPRAAPRRLAFDTGATLLEARTDDDLAQALERVVDELHNQYVLGFTPATPDGTLHTLDLRVKRPGVTVRARKAYLPR